MRIVGVIPAKGSSTRVPSKNRQEILGVPLFLWAANNLNRVLPREDIYIDTDSAEMRAQAEAHGFQVIERPDDLATNATDGNQLMLWQASQVDADIYVQHLPPMIFLKKKTLEAAIEAVASGRHASAFGAFETHAYQWTEDGPAYDLKNLPNSFTLPTQIIEGMGLYVTRRDALLKERVRVPGPSIRIELDRYEQIDIDYPEDLDFARTIARGLGPSSPYTDSIAALTQKHDIRMIVLDVDGVMTDGGMYVGETGDELKKFNTKDGMAIKKAVAAGIEVAFLSSGLKTSLIEARAKTLGVERLYVGTRPKMDVLEEWCRETEFGFENVAYVGDDINDLPVMRRVGLSACPSDATSAVSRQVGTILNRAGGQGCVREFIETFILGELQG